jgi:hypothetical protein
VRYRPLTRDQPRTVYETNPTPAVKRLLWEIHRLRAVVLRANDLVRSIDYNGTKLVPASGLALKGLREALQSEPVVPPSSFSPHASQRRSCWARATVPPPAAMGAAEAYSRDWRLAY